MRPENTSYQPIAEDALLLRLDERIDPAVNGRVHAITACLRRALPQLESVSAYASVLLRFDPSLWGNEPHQRVQAAVEAALAAVDSELPAPSEHVIEVCYGGRFGPDLDEVAAHCGMDIDTVIARHAGADYRVAMIGFAPGFPYLLGLDDALVMPRRRDPRQRVPAGSVAIGGGQTGIYPADLPGGWQLIGRTPRRLFDLTAVAPSRLAAGDHVRFIAIDEAAYRRLDQASST